MSDTLVVPTLSEDACQLALHCHHMGVSLHRLAWVKIEDTTVDRSLGDERACRHPILSPQDAKVLQDYYRCGQGLPGGPPRSRSRGRRRRGTPPPVECCASQPQGVARLRAMSKRTRLSAACPDRDCQGPKQAPSHRYLCGNEPVSPPSRRGHARSCSIGAVQNLGGVQRGDHRRTNAEGNLPNGGNRQEPQRVCGEYQEILTPQRASEHHVHDPSYPPGKVLGESTPICSVRRTV